MNQAESSSSLEQLMMCALKDTNHGHNSRDNETGTMLPQMVVSSSDAIKVDSRQVNDLKSILKKPDVIRSIVSSELSSNSSVPQMVVSSSDLGINAIDARHEHNNPKSILKKPDENISIVSSELSSSLIRGSSSGSDNKMVISGAKSSAKAPDLKAAKKSNTAKHTRPSLAPRRRRVHHHRPPGQRDPSYIHIKGCGIAELNGKYTRRTTRKHYGNYYKTGEEVTAIISRDENDSRLWRMWLVDRKSQMEIDRFYSALDASGRFPLRQPWVIDGSGTLPLPTVYSKK
jgi:hypothetical protein